MLLQPRTIIILVYLLLLIGSGLGVASAAPLSSENTTLPSDIPQPTSTITLTATQIQTDTLPVFLPLLINQLPPTPTPTITPPPRIPPRTLFYCNSDGFAIPDENHQGASSRINIGDNGYIQDIDILLDASHTWIGDLVFTLEHVESGNKVTLIDRPGYPATTSGCDQDGIKTILDDEITSHVENKCATTPLGISGIYLPEEPLSTFDNLSPTGDWKLKVTDNFPADNGRVNRWCLAVIISDSPYSPTPIPSPEPPPPQANINGVSGLPQSMPLDCESRSAVDWAAYFGVSISEYSFFNQLPRSNHPDLGFVGDPFGQWGQIPPAPYGVHAEPVAILLRDHGLDAYAHKPLSWDALRSEIASGNPVIVWIVGSVNNGIPEYYFTTDGPLTVVARYEHTVIITGYDENSVTFLNGSTFYTRSIDQFLDSWSVMGNMAITTQP